jgi:hypothetical protein
LAQANDVIDNFTGSSADLLRTLVAGIRAFDATPAGGVVKLILAEAGNFPDVASYFCTHIDARGRDLFIRTLRRGVDSGEFRPLSDLETTAIIISQPIAMFSVWKRSLAPFDPGKLDDDRFYDGYLDFVLKGLRP